jgi:hypothetical protein
MYLHAGLFSQSHRNPLNGGYICAHLSNGFLLSYDLGSKPSLSSLCKFYNYNCYF